MTTAPIGLGYVWNLAVEQRPALARLADRAPPGYGWNSAVSSQPPAPSTRGWLRGSQMVQSAIAWLRAREADARKDWAEKTSTDIARRFDVVRVENLRLRTMTRSARGTARNAARNIAAGHAVTARGGDGEARPVNREPQLLASLTGCE